MNKIRKGDEVIVIAGRDKGKRGAVAQRKDESYLLVDGVNMVKKHAKPNAGNVPDQEKNNTDTDAESCTFCV